MIVELILDFLPWPTRSEGLADGIARKLDPGSFRPETPGAIKRALNESGWLDEEVIAAGELMQGAEPSFASMLTGVALIELVRPRRWKLLPRDFVLAVTVDRVVAFKASGGADSETGGPYLLSHQARGARLLAAGVGAPGRPSRGREVEERHARSRRLRARFGLED
jgi:hypothetical protein